MKDIYIILPYFSSRVASIHVCFNDYMGKHFNKKRIRASIHNTKYFFIDRHHSLVGKVDYLKKITFSWGRLKKSPHKRGIILRLGRQFVYLESVSINFLFLFAFSIFFYLSQPVDLFPGNISPSKIIHVFLNPLLGLLALQGQYLVSTEE